MGRCCYSDKLVAKFCSGETKAKPLIEFHSMQGWTATTKPGVTGKGSKKC